MTEPGRPLRGRYALAVMAAGWACAWPALHAENGVSRLMRRCLDGPGVPGYALVLAWTGLLLNAAATLWVLLLAVRTRRDRSRPLGLAGGLLLAALPAALLVGVLQYALLQDVRAHAGPQRSPCEGAPVRAGWVGAGQ
ncbi:MULTISPECIES: hypothetical protein [Kitasatospora]|uniref:Uncharacterized protein n=1 Tax=Kitasatospora setae (strain ATCC 33774 / DSM 43861 / JCM 3304 / KCC A-0304 / NBRC 14216 / KM-6054) TaxID=452652 RepID=E4N8Z2_KITSK|nr:MULTISPECIES: hypothetical protein [Kitasatospora]BAJ27673.1 hypothetical protein KSE_18480 [Kitasatospora setae KM-6054]